MLFLFLLHIVVSISCLAVGLLLYSCTGSLVEESGQYMPFIVYIITGLVIISIIFQVVVVFVPINFYSTGIASVCLLVLAINGRKIFYDYFRYLIKTITHNPKICTGLIIIIWWMVLLLSAGPTIMDDTDSYHVQIIKWIQQYGTVPGLANLHERFGFNSAWLTLLSIFIPSGTTANYYSLMNGLLSIWLAAYLLGTLWKSVEQKLRGNGGINPAGIVLVLLFAFICWPLIRGNATNANYDFITTCVTLVLFLELWKNRVNTAISDGLLIALFLWPVLLFTVRITNYPMLLFSLFAFVHCLQHKKFLFAGLLTSLCVVTIASFLARNVILSGYLFYPVYQFDIFNVDWKADAENAREIATFIKYFNRAPYSPLSITALQQYTGLSWIPVWFRYMLNYDKVLLLVALPGFLITIFKIKRLGITNTAVRLSIFILCLQLLSWMAVAPDPRFAYGALLAGAYLFGLHFEKMTGKLFNQTTRTLAFGIAGVLILYYNIHKITSDKNYRNFVTPILLPLPPVKISKTNNISLYIPEKINGNWNARCFATNLPCLYKIHPGLEGRSTNIKDGFKIKK